MIYFTLSGILEIIGTRCGIMWGLVGMEMVSDEGRGGVG